MAWHTVKIASLWATLSAKTSITSKPVRVLPNMHRVRMESVSKAVFFLSVFVASLAYCKQTRKRVLKLGYLSGPRQASMGRLFSLPTKNSRSTARASRSE
ncbi:hypothetical protein B0H12DRAFT_1158811 [Mycena haematopus]|nr:hypothetical protein B0H12DRAFT_1158811 [Mycena haematopus]